MIKEKLIKKEEESLAKNSDYVYDLYYAKNSEIYLDLLYTNNYTIESAAHNNLLFDDKIKDDDGILFYLSY